MIATRSTILSALVVASLIPCASGADAGLMASSLGVTLHGFGLHANSGFAVSNAGDVDGDGLDDILIGALGAGQPDRPYSGLTTLVFGSALARADQANANIELATLQPTEGVHIWGRSAEDRSGVAVSGAGDIDGDGLADIVIGAQRAEVQGVPLAGEVLVVFGKALLAARGADGVVDGAKLLPRDGVIITGSTGNHVGWSVARAGDVDADGLSDLVIGGWAPVGSPGAATVLAGHAINAASQTTGTLDLSDPPSGGSLVLHGVSRNDFVGLEVSGAGDINADGYDDVLLGASGAVIDGTVHAGAAYIVSGVAIAATMRAGETEIAIESLLGRGATTLSGATFGDNTGRAVAAAGDVDRDGQADILIGAWSAQPAGKHWCGSVYLVFGRALADRAQDLIAHVDLSNLIERGGITIRGAAPDDYAGWAVSGAGDVNGDGFADILVGAHGADPSGAAYLLFGAALAEAVGRGGEAAVLELADLPARIGLKLEGRQSGSTLGHRVSAAGDVDGDGLSDVIIGAPYAVAQNGDAGTGQSILVTGKRLHRERERYSSIPTARIGQPERVVIAQRQPAD